MISILFKRLLLIIILGTALNATTLKELLTSTLKNNKNLKSIKSLDLSKQKTYQSVSNTFNPMLNIGANYLQLDGDIRNAQVGKTSIGFAKFTMNLYDGGKGIALKKQKEYEYKSVKLESSTTIKETLLSVVTLFFQTKTIQENIEVLKEKSKALKAQYERVQTKYNIQMTTIDEVLKLQSEYETNQYTIEELKYQKEQLMQNLYLLCGITIDTLDNSILPDVKDLTLTKSESIKSLEFAIKAQNENINIISSGKKPQIKLEDSYNIYKYNSYNEKLLTDLPNNQNQLMFTLSFNLFDTTTKQKRKASKLAKKALQEKLEFLKQQERMKFDLAKKKLDPQELKIKSLKSAVNMGNSVYSMIKTKYQNGIVDNITYLDALSKKIYNIALYKQALNDYEIAKANYYFASGVDYKLVLSKF